MQPQIVSFKVAQTKPSLTPCIETKDVPTDLQLDMCQKCGKFQRLKRDPTSASNKFFRISEHTDKLERNERTMFRIPLYPWGSFVGMLIGNVAFVLVMAGDENLYGNPFDEIIGSGRQSIIPENKNPIFHFLHQQGLMSRKFGFYFQDSWQHIRVGDNLEQLITAPGTPYDDFFATGTNTVSLPEDIHMVINEVLGIWRKMHHVYVFDCGMLRFPPPIFFQIQGKMLQIMPKRYTKKTTIDGITMCCTRFQNNTPNCPVDIVLGMAFLHPFQLIFDNHFYTVWSDPRDKTYAFSSVHLTNTFSFGTISLRNVGTL
ncbi:hypothetical protein T265_14850, partial [Opisthorchis viverrini]